MSRKLLMVAALAAMALPIANARAQLGFGAAAGLSAPTGNFGNAVSSGYHLTGLVTFSAPLSPIGFRGEASFNQFAFKSPATGNFNIVSGTANVVAGMPGMMGLYGIAGLGIYHPSCSGCTSQNKIGFNGGAGFKFGLSGFSAFVEARYHSVSTTGSNTTYIPVSFGVTF